MAIITSGNPPATTGDSPPPSEMLIDRISDLPEPLLLHILSLLPTHRAAQTSCLSRHFRKLWSASPSLYFDRRSFRVTPKFLKMVNYAFLGRDCSVPVERVRIVSSYYSRCLLPVTMVGVWIKCAESLGVRHLNLTLEAYTVMGLCYIIFSIKSLESLHISTLHFGGQIAYMPEIIKCTRLKSLFMWLDMESADLTRLVSGLPVLEFLELRGIDQNTIDISSQSLKTLKLQCNCRKMKLYFPYLEFMYLHCKLSTLKVYQGKMPLVSKAEFTLNSPVEESDLVARSMLKSVANAVELSFSVETRMTVGKTNLGCCEMPLTMPRLECLKFSSSACYLKLFQVEMPMLRKSDIMLYDATEEFVLPISGLLKCFENVVELKLSIWDHWSQSKPFHIWEPNKKPQSFPHLVDFELFTCCHDAAIEDVISLLENSPVLNYLKMRHKDPCINSGKQHKKKTVWQSKLPRNSEGNFQHSCFKDFHKRNEKSQVVKQLSRRLASMKRKHEN